MKIKPMSKSDRVNSRATPEILKDPEPDSEPHKSDRWIYQPSKYAKINGATIVASDSMINFGVSIPSLPQVIFSFGTAPEYEP